MNFSWQWPILAKFSHSRMLNRLYGHTLFTSRTAQASDKARMEHAGGYDAGGRWHAISVRDTQRNAEIAGSATA